MARMSLRPRRESASSLAPLAIRDFRLLFIGFVAAQAVSLETLFPILSYVCLGAVAMVLLTRRQLWRIRVVVASGPAETETPG